MPEDQTPKRALRAASAKPSSQASRSLRRRLRRSRPRRGEDPRATLVDVQPGEAAHLDAPDEEPATDARTEDTSTGDIRSEDTPSQDTPTEDSQSDDTPTEDSQSEDTSSEDTPTDDTPSEQQAAERVAKARSRRARLVQSLVRPGRGQVVAAIILLIFGMGGVMQIRASTEDDAYSSARREDLIQLLDGLTQESRRLEGEIVELEQTRDQLESGADTSEVARKEAEKRVSVLSVLAGTVPAHGPGVRMRISDPQGKVTADLLLDAVEELRDAGAEVIEFNDAIRVVANTWFGTGPNGLIIDGREIETPIVIEAIGNPHSLEEAARFRGGLVSEITSDKVGGQVVIEQLGDVQITSLHEPAAPQYAQPASAPPTPR